MSTKEYGTDKKLEIDNIFLGLGSNQGDRKLNLKNSIKLLNSRVGKVLNTSRIYESEPWGVKNQNYFLNQVIEIETHIDPNDLLNICKNIELDGFPILVHLTKIYIYVFSYTCISQTLYNTLVRKRRYWIYM